MEQEQLFALLAKSLTYAGIVYKQSTYPTDQSQFDNDFRLEYKHTSIPEDSLLFFVPSVSSNASGACKLTIRVPYVSGQDGTTIRYADDEYSMVVETTDGVYRAAGQGDVIANRMCIFRFDFASKRAILINSPLYNEAAFSLLTVTDGRFVNRPKVKDPSAVNEYVDVATMGDIATLLARIEALEGKIIFGTEDPDEALADLPTGTVYIQVQED